MARIRRSRSRAERLARNWIMYDPGLRPMSERAPMVTIGVPVYNGASFLRETLDALLAQDFEAFELIISDNGSTDATRAIGEEYAARDGRVRYVRSDVNRGAAWNYNRLVELARGTYFKWAAHDDLHLPSCVRRCVEVLESAPPSVALAYPRTILVSEEGCEIERYDDRLDTRCADPIDRLRHVVGKLELCNAVVGMFRLDTLRRTGLIRPFGGSDEVLLAEVSLLGEIWEVPEYLFLRRRHPAASRVVNRSWRSVAVWFDPASRYGRVIPPSARLVIEHVRMILRSPLGRRARLRGALAYLSTHYGRRLRVRAGALKRRLRSPLGHARAGERSDVPGLGTK